MDLETKQEHLDELHVEIVELESLVEDIARNMVAVSERVARIHEMQKVLSDKQEKF